MFHERLKARRTEQGRSMEWLADAARIRVGTLYTYESGEREPKVSTAAAMARALGCSLDWLVGLDENPTPKKSSK